MRRLSLSASPDDAFCAVAKRVMNKNAELYRRLS
jgi:hypothetical protein